MQDANAVILSVRGDARQLVPPDYVVLEGSVRAVAAVKDDALRIVGAAQRRLGEGLRELGAVAFAPESARAPLTWSSHSLHTRPEWDHKRDGATGRTVAQLSVAVYVRDLALLPAVGEAFAGIAELDLQQVSWHVDADNAHWRTVRAAAIQAALRKGLDYAAALGGAVERIEHIADVGLLGSGDHAQGYEQAARVMGAAGFSRGDGPSLDPVPQVISATIEARFVASVAPLRPMQ